jgi:hypothetical protein
MDNTIRFFKTAGDSKIIFGEVVDETDNFYKIRGMYLVYRHEEFEASNDKETPYGVNATTQPFSPVGPQIQTISYPKSRIEMEFLDMPPVFANTLIRTYAAEQQNAKIREKLLAMPTPTRNAANPEEALAKIAQFVKKEGKLPIANTPMTTHDSPQGVTAGVFNVLQTSPYRETANDPQ